MLLMEEILHQLIGSLSHDLQGFIHPRWCRISSINSSDDSVLKYPLEDIDLGRIVFKWVVCHKVGPVTNGVTWGPYKWPEING